MIDLKDRAQELRNNGIIKGKRPLFVDIVKGNYPYKGRYIVTYDEIGLTFCQLKRNYSYKGSKAIDFIIKYQMLEGYHLHFDTELTRKISLYFKDGLEFVFKYPCGYDEAYDNGHNATSFMENLKAHNILQKNVIKGGANGQKAISKTDQFIVKEIRSPKKTGLFR